RDAQEQRRGGKDQDRQSSPCDARHSDIIVASASRRKVRGVRAARYIDTATGRPENFTERVSFCPATRSSMSRTSGARIREPGTSETERRRAASDHVNDNPIQAPRR